MDFEGAWHKLFVYLGLLSKITILLTTPEEPSHVWKRRATIGHDILEVRQRSEHRFVMARVTGLSSVSFVMFQFRRFLRNACRSEHPEALIIHLSGPSEYKLPSTFWIQASLHLLHRFCYQNVVLNVSRSYFFCRLFSNISNKYDSTATPTWWMSKLFITKVHNPYCGLVCRAHA